MSGRAPGDSAPVLVTGATGFLGGRIAQALLDRGESVRVLCRKGREGLAPAGAEPVAGDVTDAASFDRAASGARAIVHVAARVARGGSWRDFESVNVGGLTNALHAAASRRVPRIVYTSSFFALGPSDLEPGGEPASEDSVLRAASALDHYQASKREAALIARRAADAGAPLVTLYPGVIVGPGRLTEGNFITAMLRDHLRGKLVPLPAGGRKTWSYVHVDDVVAGHLAALDAPAPGSSYVLGGENASLRDLFERVRELTGARPPWISAPPALLWSVGLGEEAAQALFGRAPKQLTRGVARVLGRSWALDSARAKAELGHDPRPLRSILEQTIAWLQEQGHVPRGTLARGGS
jgi:NAD+-dependent farnesol dehydrogenase